MAWYQIFYWAILTIVLLVGWFAHKKSHEKRTQLRHTAYQEGVGEEFDQN
jgi:hypothetical protein